MVRLLSYIGGEIRAKYQKWLESENLILLEGWAREGLTDIQIAGKIGISKQTLYDWKKKYADFSDSLKKGKDVIDRQVENALLKRALGYEYEETSEKYEGGELVEKKITKKQVVPDTTAQIFWLKNRQPSKWRDKVQVDSEAEFSKVDELIASIDRLAKS